MPLEPPPPLPKELEDLLKSSEALITWMMNRIDNLEVPGHLSAKVPALLFDLALEHHFAVFRLTDSRMYGSAFALVRVEFEALIRAAWLQLRATPEQLKKVMKTDEYPLRFGEMIEAIETHADFPGNTLTNLKKNSYKALNSYTHGGMLQVERRLKGNTIEPCYDTEEIIEVLKVSASFALIALLQIARLAKNLELEKEIEAMLLSEKS